MGLVGARPRPAKPLPDDLTSILNVLSTQGYVTNEDLRKAWGVSRSTAWKRVKDLVSDGFLRPDHFRPRDLEELLLELDMPEGTGIVVVDNVNFLLNTWTSRQGIAPPGTTAVHYTFHDKGVVTGQDSVTPDASGLFTIPCDAKALHGAFPMLSLTAHEGRWERLSDEVAINMLAVGDESRGNTVMPIGEEVFIGGDLDGRDCRREDALGREKAAPEQATPPRF